MNQKVLVFPTVEMHQVTYHKLELAMLAHSDHSSDSIKIVIQLYKVLAIQPNLLPS